MNELRHGCGAIVSLNVSCIEHPGKKCYFNSLYVRRSIVFKNLLDYKQNVKQLTGTVWS